ncbi:unnamed protein product [Linum trigynum]|uniref:RNase H type-1 domain-containing protein n=1 Tax=Linum trigynum TaxID=586398 RepID=A0AAV2EEV5_9ROSI
MVVSHNKARVMVERDYAMSFSLPLVLSKAKYPKEEWITYIYCSHHPFISYNESCQCAVEERSSSVVYSDCKVLVDAINGCPSTWSWRCYASLEAIRRIMHLEERIRIFFISRRNNKCADWVAKNCRLDALHHDWIHVLNVISDLL